MRNTSTKLIDGKKYEVGSWAIDKQIGMMARLLGLLGEPLAMFIMGSGGAKSVGQAAAGLMNKELDPIAVSKAIGQLSARLKPEEMISLFRDVTEGVLVNNKKLNFEIDFNSKLSTMFKVSLFAVRHQYSDFLDAASDLKGEAADTSSTQE